MITSRIDTKENRKYMNLHINGQQTRLKLDTTPDITIILRKLWNSLGHPKRESVFLYAVSACGGSVKLTEKLIRNVKYCDTCISATGHIAKSKINLHGLD